MRPRAALPGVMTIAVLLALVLAAAVSCVPGGAASTTGQAAAPEPLLGSLQPGRAVLVSGTTAVRGLPGFGRNALPALAGEYAYQPGGSAAGDIIRIPVWFTREMLLFTETWAATPCAGLPVGTAALALPAGADGSSLWALRTGGYTLFAMMPPDFAEPCRFSAVLAERMAFFQRYAERPEDSSFPAILDIGR